MIKTITFELSEKSIDKAIEKLDAYKMDLQSKCDEMSRRVAEYFKARAQTGFSGAAADTRYNKETHSLEIIPANVTVTVEPSGDGIYMVVAHGEDAIWAEFGAGIYFNGPVGSSPNPLGADNGFTIGSFGPNGARRIWGTGKGWLSRGTPAFMPMATAMMEVEQDLFDIAKGVFE